MHDSLITKITTRVLRLVAVVAVAVAAVAVAVRGVQHLIDPAL